MYASRRDILVGLAGAALSGAVLTAPGSALAADASAWNGSWSGQLGQRAPWPITITILDGKVVRFIEKGVGIKVAYSSVTPTRVSFGDHDHYSVWIDRNGASSAVAVVSGRHGAGHAKLTRG